VATIVFEGDLGQLMRLELGVGDLLVLAAAAAWGLYTALLRSRPPLAPISFLALTFGIGAVVLVPFAVAEWQAGMTVRWSAAVLGAYVYVAVLASIAAYFMFNAAAARAGPAAAGQAITLLPLFGAVLSAMVLGEPLHGYHAIGMVLIVAAIAAGAWSQRAKSSAGEPAKPALEDAR
jgi:drug/metabolite transporter (DMT)-like permease